MRIAWLLILSVPLIGVSGVRGADAGPLLARLKSVKAEGGGNVEASKAWRELVALGPDALLPTLTALDDADATAANWLLTAVDAIAEHELAAGRSLPAAKLEAFVLDTKHNGPARRLAYEWLTQVDPKAPERLLPGMLQDPNAELRRDAVAAALQKAEKLSAKDSAIAAYRRALTAARDRDQVELIIKRLQTFGVEVDLTAHLGFVQKWQLIGPFDHTGGKGFDAVYPPEKGVDLAARYKGKKDAEVGWKEYATSDTYGNVDLNKAIGKNMGAVAYAHAVVESATEQPVELRLGSTNAVKVFLNGKPVFAHEEYHHGMNVDQYVGRGTLKAGKNEILIKVCQNEQTETWAQGWAFQLRLCDALGAAVPFKVLTEGKGER
jgi:hypothetical protein